VVLCGFLLFAGLGSACSGWLARRAQVRGWSPLTVAVIAVVVIAVAYVMLLPFLFGRFAVMADSLKIGMSLLLIAPLAFFMGMPFPIGLSRVADAAPAFVPWAWGINGFASVVSASLATLLAVELGFTAVVVLALLLYAVAALVFKAWPSEGKENQCDQAHTAPGDVHDGAAAVA
jgi:MFS family permease